MRLSLQHSVNLHTLLVGNHLHSAISLFSLLFHLKNFNSPYEDEQVLGVRVFSSESPIKIYFAAVLSNFGLRLSSLSCHP